MRYPVLALAAFSTAAVAQTSTTNCSPDFIGGWRCSTTPAVTPNSDAYGALIRSMPRPYIPSPEQMRQTEIQARVAKVSKMIAKGDCAGAEQYALEHGDLPLAQSVRAYCAK